MKKIIMSAAFALGLGVAAIGANVATSTPASAQVGFSVHVGDPGYRYYDRGYHRGYYRGHRHGYYRHRGYRYSGYRDRDRRVCYYRYGEYRCYYR